MSTMKSNRDLYQSSATAERLGDLLVATVRYIPLLTLLLALGLLGVYALAQYNILGQPAQQLLIAAGISLGVGLAHVPLGRIRTLVRGGRVWVALSIFWALLAIWSVSIVLLWESVAPVAVVMAWVSLLVLLAAGVRGRWLLGIAAASLVLSAALVWLGANPPFARLTTGNPAGLAAVVLLASTVVLFVLGTIVARLFRYRSVQGRLVTAFTLIMAVPVLFTTAVAALTSYNNSQSQFRDTLQAVSTL